MGCFHGKPSLSKDDVNFLVQHTNFDEASIRDWFSGFCQDCPDGKLKKQKFIEMYKLFFPSGNAEQFCDHVFRTFDLDNSDFIDFKEFLFAIDVTSKGTAKQKLEWAFTMYDVDGNGTIEVGEMTTIVQAIYNMLGNDLPVQTSNSPAERAQAIFAQMDTDGDGRLSREEFMQGCLEDSELSRILTSPVSQ